MQSYLNDGEITKSTFELCVYGNTNSIDEYYFFEAIYKVKTSIQDKKIQVMFFSNRRKNAYRK